MFHFTCSIQITISAIYTAAESTIRKEQLAMYVYYHCTVELFWQLEHTELAKGVWGCPQETLCSEIESREWRNGNPKLESMSSIAVSQYWYSILISLSVILPDCYLLTEKLPGFWVKITRFEFVWNTNSLSSSYSWQASVDGRSESASLSMLFHLVTHYSFMCPRETTKTTGFSLYFDLASIDMVQFNFKLDCTRM